MCETFRLSFALCHVTDHSGLSEEYLAAGILMTLSENQSSVSSRTVFYTITRELLKYLNAKARSLKPALNLRPHSLPILFVSQCLAYKRLSVKIVKPPISSKEGLSHKILSRRKWNSEVK